VRDRVDPASRVRVAPLPHRTGELRLGAAVDGVVLEVHHEERAGRAPAEHLDVLVHAGRAQAPDQAVIAAAVTRDAGDEEEHVVGLRIGGTIRATAQDKQKGDRRD
jgi:hypothetical protein